MEYHLDYAGLFWFAMLSAGIAYILYAWNKDSNDPPK